MNKKIYSLIIDKKILIVYFLCLLLFLFNLFLSIYIYNLKNNSSFDTDKYKTLIVFNLDKNIDNLNIISKDDNKCIILFDSWIDTVNFYENNIDNYSILYLDYDVQNLVINYYDILNDSIKIKKIFKILSFILNCLFIILIYFINSNKYNLLFFLGFNRFKIIYLYFISVLFICVFNICIIFI